MQIEPKEAEPTLAKALLSTKEGKKEKSNDTKSLRYQRLSTSQYTSSLINNSESDEDSTASEDFHIELLGYINVLNDTDVNNA